MRTAPKNEGPPLVVPRGGLVTRHLSTRRLTGFSVNHRQTMALRRTDLFFDPAGSKVFGDPFGSLHLAEIDKYLRLVGGHPSVLVDPDVDRRAALALGYGHLAARVVMLVGETHAPEAGGGHSQAIAWMAAGWETAKVDIPGETLLFRRRRTVTKRRPSLDEVWPVHSAGGWPKGLSLDRAEIYEGRT